MSANAQTVIQWMEQLAPKVMAVENDRIGLQIGSLQKNVSNVLIALDVTDEVVEEAVRLHAELIIAHHAIIFKPLTHLQTDTPVGRLYEKLLNHHISVYIAHTNYDVAAGGMNDLMAHLLQLTDVNVLATLQHEPFHKLVVFVPASHAQQVRTAILNAGSGQIGAYSHCSFNINGIGTFQPQEGANPFIGHVGKLEEVQEVRIETIVPQSIQKRVVQSMLSAHPYDEVAYDLYPVHFQGTAYGLGRVGKLVQPATLQQLANLVKEKFAVPHVRVVGDLERPIRKVAVLGGSGSRFSKHALFHGADVLITGDIDYHMAHDALAAGLSLIDPGHNAEKIMKADVAARLQAVADKHGAKIHMHASAICTEPFQFL